MNAGDTVTHKQSGEELTIKKLYKSVASCYLKTPVRLSDTLTVETRIVKIENLIKTNVMRLPKLYEVLAFQRKSKGKYESMYQAIVEDGNLVVSADCMIALIPLRIYFSEKEVEFAEGKVFSEELLKKMAATSITELELTETKIKITTKKGVEEYFYAGEKEGEHYVFQNIFSGTKEGGNFTYPNYKPLFEYNTIPGLFPNVGINADTLNTLANCFNQSINKDMNLRIEMFEGNNSSYPVGNMRITPAGQSEEGLKEIALFTSTPLPTLKEMEDLV